MPVFVIHEHHATRLHYDFRLEIDGVLKSWAIPKGPSLNPAEKRLAIQVEDHPLDYGSYEGIIPHGYYGAGAVVIWDTGTFEIVEGSLKEKKMVLEFRGKTLRGRFSFFAFKNEPKNWLLIKKKDGYEKPSFKIQTLLATKKLAEKKPSCNIED